jgi:hypothetical protein
VLKKRRYEQSVPQRLKPQNKRTLAARLSAVPLSKTNAVPVKGIPPK